MAGTSAIEWTDATWQPITGCSLESPGCTNCYAMKLAGGRLRHHPSRAGLTTMTKAGPVWNGQVRFNEQWAIQPLGWSKPKRIFVCAHGDLFHENVPDEWIDKVFAVMALAPWHTFQVLTKRSARMREYFAGWDAFDRIIPLMMWLIEEGFAVSRNESCARHGIPWTKAQSANDWWPLRNVWLGVSAEDQRRADERRDHLADLAKQGWTTFVSYEPAIGPVDWVGWDFLKQLISGGESGPGSRPSHPDWHRVARDFCKSRGIEYFFKQWGNWKPLDQFSEQLIKGAGIHGVIRHDGRFVVDADLADPPGAVFTFNVGKKAAGRLLDGVEHNGMPEARG